MDKHEYRADAASPAHQRKTLNGVAFTLGAYGITRALNLLVTVLLARTLDPQGMGLIAAALLGVEIIDMLRGLGLKESLIYDRSGSLPLQSTALLIILAVALLQALALAFAAPLAANFVEDPLIIPMLKWLALLFPIVAVGTVPEAVLHRQLRFAAVSVAEILGVMVKAAVAISMICLGYGIWSIVAGMLVGSATRSAAFAYFSAWRPVRPRTDSAAFFALVGYGKHIFISNLLNFMRMRADQLAIVTAMGDAALGIYFVASRIPDIVILGVNSAMTKVIFPTFSDLSDKPGRLAEMYVATIGGAMLVMAPISIGLMSVAPQAVPLFFGAQWDEAVPILIALAAAGLPQTIGWTAGDLFKATGRPHLLSLLMLAQMGTTIPLIAAAAFLAGNLVWIATGIFVGECIVSGIRLWYMQRLEGISARATLMAAARPILAAAIMGLVVLGVAAELSAIPPALRLALSMMAGAVVYPLIIYLIDRDNVLRWTGPLRLSRKEG